MTATSRERTVAEQLESLGGTCSKAPRVPDPVGGIEVHWRPPICTRRSGQHSDHPKETIRTALRFCLSNSPQQAFNTSHGVGLLGNRPLGWLRVSTSRWSSFTGTPRLCPTRISRTVRTFRQGEEGHHGWRGHRRWDQNRSNYRLASSVSWLVTFHVKSTVLMGGQS